MLLPLTGSLSPLGARRSGAAGPLILDQFTDTNGTGLASHTIAPTNTPATAWTVRQGSFSIQSNRAQCSTSFTDLVTVEAGIADGTFSVVIIPTADSLTNGVDQGLVLRQTNTSNYVEVVIQGQMFKAFEVGGGFTLLDSEAVTITAGVSYTIEVIVSGSTYTATLNGGSMLSFTSTKNQSTARHGLNGSNSTQFDDFTVST